MQRLRWAALTLLGVAILGSLGYWLLFDFGLLDAVYQTVTTITTVGFREVEPMSGAGQVFTIFVILFGVGTALYTFGNPPTGTRLRQGHVLIAMGSPTSSPR